MFSRDLHHDVEDPKTKLGMEIFNESDTKHVRSHYQLAQIPTQREDELTKIMSKVIKKAPKQDKGSRLSDEHQWLTNEHDFNRLSAHKLAPPVFSPQHRLDRDNIPQ